jgi:hypothetical protein
MRDPADVIATALHENVVQGMTVEQWREKAVQVLVRLTFRPDFSSDPQTYAALVIASLPLLVFTDEEA